MSVSEVADCLKVEGRAVSSADDYRSLYHLAFDEAEKHAKNKILLVVQRVNTIPMAEIYFIASQNQALSTQADYKIAIVSTGSGPHDAEEFFVTVASNRGANIQAFRRLDSAECWLNCGDQ